MLAGPPFHTIALCCNSCVVLAFEIICANTSQAIRTVTSQPIAWTPAGPFAGPSWTSRTLPRPRLTHPQPCPALSPLLERSCPSFTNLCNKLYQPHWSASAHLHLTLAPEDFMSSLPNCLPCNRLPSLAADSKRVRSTRVCLVSVYIYIWYPPPPKKKPTFYMNP